ncbi:MAG: hypothetical protein R6U20_09205, partial [Longimonas sp.]
VQKILDDYYRDRTFGGGYSNGTPAADEAPTEPEEEYAPVQPSSLDDYADDESFDDEAVDDDSFDDEFDDEDLNEADSPA